MSRFYFKAMIKNILFLFMLLGIIFYTFITRKAASISIVRYTSLYTFALAISCIGIMILCVYVAGKRYNFMTYLEKPHDKFKAMLMAAIKIITIFYLINIVVILFNIGSINNIFFSVKGIIHFTVIWYLSNILMSVIGLIIGIFVSNFTRYIICLILSYPFIMQVPKGVIESKVEMLFNIFDDKIFSPPNHGAGVIFNNFYLLDKLFILFFISFAVYFMYIFMRKKNYKILAISVCLFIMIQSVIIYNYKNIEIRDISANNSAIDTKEKYSYHINNYTMDMQFKNKLYNKCNMSISLDKNDAENITLYLDRGFTIDKLLLDSKSVEYSFSDGKIVIPLQDKKMEKELNISIEYSGRAYVMNSLSTDSIYTSRTANTLINDVVNWYPQVSQEELCNYEIKGTSLTEMYSNIPLKNTKGNALSYSFSGNGRGKGINLISGNYGVYNHNGTEIICPKNVFSEGIANALPGYAEELFTVQKAPKEDLDRIKNAKYKRIILVSGLGSVGYIDGDTLILDNSWID